MAEINTGPDALGIYLTGAAVAGDPQSSHSASLGGYPSSSRANVLTVHRLNPIRYITITHVSGLNGAGIGQLRCDTTGSLRWTPPVGTQGPSVAIANGETKVLTGGAGHADKYIIVNRTSALPLGGTGTVQLLDTVNNVVGGSNFTGDEAVTGTYKGRCISLKNNGAASITGLIVWFDSDYDTYCRIAKEAPVDGAYQVVADEYTRPTGLSWSTPTTEGTALSIGTLASGEEYGLRIERYISQNMPCSPLEKTVINIKYTYDGHDYYKQIRGASRIANNFDAIGVPTAALAAYWRCENSVSLNDFSDGGYTAPASGTGQTLGTGKFGSCITMDGNGFFATTSTSISNNWATNSATFAFWFKTTTTNDAFLGSYQNTSTPFIRITQTGTTSNHGVRFGVSADGTNIVYTQTNTAFNNDTWHHCAAVIDRTGNKIYLYIDGTIVDANGASISGLGTFAAARVLNIGNMGPGSSSYKYVGSLDEITVWTRALSSTEITLLKNATAPLTPHPLYPYQVFVGEDADPGDTTATIEFSDLTYDITGLTNSHSWNIRIAQTNQYGVQGPTELQLITLDGSGNQLYPPPRGPANVRLMPVAGGYFKVTANYNPYPDGAHPADTWLLYYTTDGSTPDPSSDTPVEIGMSGSPMLNWTSANTYAAGTVIKIIVRTYRSTDAIESTNSEVYATAIVVTGPSAPVASASIGLAIGINPVSNTGSRTYYVDETNEIAFIETEGGIGFWVGDLLIWNIKASSALNPGNGVHTTFTRTYGAVSGNCVETPMRGIEVAEFTEESQILYVAVNDGGTQKRAIKIDVLQKLITVTLFRPATLESQDDAIPPVKQVAGYTLFQDMDEETEQYMTAMCVATDGQMGTAEYVPWRTHKTQEECL